MNRAGATGGLWRAARWPVLVILVAALAIGLAALLDSGSPTQRDYALVVGAPAMYVVLPLAVLWLVFVVVHTLWRSPH